MVSQGTMYVVNADGSDQSRLTDYPQTSLPYQGSFDPTFSPQGKLVLQSSRLYNSEILLMNAGGSDISSLTLIKTSDIDPAFSPDGSQTTFATEPTVIRHPEPVPHRTTSCTKAPECPLARRASRPPGSLLTAHPPRNGFSISRPSIFCPSCRSSLYRRVQPASRAAATIRES